MKKFAIIALALLLIGCSFFQSNSPKEAAITLMDSLANMDFEKAKTAADNALQEKINDLQKLTGRDPVSETSVKSILDFMDYEVLSEKIDGDTASLRLKISAFSEETVEAIKLKMALAGISVSDDSDPHSISEVLVEALEELDLDSLEKVSREVELKLKKIEGEWRFTEDTLTRITEALFSQE